MGGDGGSGRNRGCGRRFLGRCRRAPADAGHLKKRSESIASLFIKVNMGVSAALLGLEEFNEQVNWTGHRDGIPVTGTEDNPESGRG